MAALRPLSLLLLLSALCGSCCGSAAGSVVSSVRFGSRPAVLLRLRAGADEDEEDEDEDEFLDGDLEGEGGDTKGGEGLEANPFLGSGTGGLDEMKKSLQDPAAIQRALRELQDPATQQRFRQMLEDPAFLESMKAYAEQIAKDPMFEQLKEQAEKMMYAVATPPHRTPPIAHACRPKGAQGLLGHLRKSMAVSAAIDAGPPPSRAIRRRAAAV
eukprot:scaffold94626_cov30-Tisochrysis_lutea.AAC.2